MLDWPYRRNIDPGNGHPACLQCGTKLRKFAPCPNCPNSFWEVREDVPYQPELRQLTRVQAQTQIEDITRLHIASFATRAGWMLFSTDIEYSNFHPHTIFNDAYELRYVVWEGHLFQIMSIPINAQGIVAPTAARYELAVKDNIPLLIRIRGMPSMIDGILVSVPRRVIPYQQEWARDMLSRMVGVIIPIDRVEAILFPLSGDTLKIMEASPDATGKYRDREVELEERERLVERLGELF